MQPIEPVQRGENEREREFQVLTASVSGWHFLSPLKTGTEKNSIPSKQNKTLF